MITAINWDAWRAAYDEMSFEEHQAFNAECLRQHPEQKSWDAGACAMFLIEREPKTVVELGGWDGSLAAEMLERFDGIKTWVNYDITPGVPQECSDPRYQVIVLDVWPWEIAPTADALVASHVFEHIRMDEVERLVNAWNVDSVYVDCPIGGGTDWRGYHGSHILEASVNEFLTRIAAAGYDVTYSGPGLIAYLDAR